MDMRILKYGITYDPNGNTGNIMVRLENEKEIHVRFENMLEFAAIILVLKNPPVFLNEETGKNQNRMDCRVSAPLIFHQKATIHFQHSFFLATASCKKLY